ncbi:YecR family lipoprotein [Pseudomonas sp. NPDC090202]|uniref:YecR family lipoprotein n=1 Tax=unclassified Pseudomonas TaxID=196821 RepID=UPI0038063C2C
MALAAVAIAGCVQNPTDISALDGSRADGMVTVAFQGNNRITSADFSKRLTIAAARCSAWGYQGADKFGNQFTRCTSANYFGCATSEIVVKYQCLGNPDMGAARVTSSGV